eukprot:CAMPEP_0196158672 /NCGR_PEP_ID=MMETSP0910-20130528/45933_1 /TAXON_ID=49265 /ORGANISM="Thalassiosira rotula, Strain GSO102" /LENGTH=75 /DNA_ID=CAMNT_0041423581 /DNA_START=246 /DNA_END=473 /DNA_ORIENTATION=+
MAESTQTKKAAPKKAAPKKAKGGKKKLSNYMLFAKDTRPKIIEENPDLTFGEVGKELGKRWRALTDDEKAEWKSK